jgi:hypothetical protein
MKNSSIKKDTTRQLRVIASLMVFGLGAVGTALAVPPPATPTHGVTVSPASKKVAVSPTSNESFVPLAMPQPANQPIGAGITFTCDATIAADGPPGLCASLATVISPLYFKTFTNANASIYIEFNAAAGLADTTQFSNLVPYATYQAALQSASTDTAKFFVPAAEPSIFGGRQANLTSALAQALGITQADQGGGIGPIAGVTDAGGYCSTPGTAGCYHALIRVNTPANLKSQNGQGYTYRTLSGSVNGTTDNYDFYSVVEHELDEALGSASCVSYPSAGSLGNVSNCASAVDMFRYTATGTRTFNTLPSMAYFSPDGGLTDTQGNLYNTTSPGGDWADFSQSCVFVQDAGACPSSILAANSFDITTEGPGGTAGPEVAILNAVGYNLLSGGNTNGPPAVVSLTPTTGTGLTQTFTAVYSDPNGIGDLSAVRLLFSNTGTVSSCYVFYTPSNNALFLADDAGDRNGVAPLTPGSSASESNSQCTLSGSGSSVTSSGNTLTLTAAITFNGSYAGWKNVYLRAESVLGSTSGWVPKGQWEPVNNGSPLAVSVTPASGTGLTQTFAAAYSDPNGTTDLNNVRIMLNSQVSGFNACYVFYYPGSNKMALIGDGNTSLGAVVPGSSTQLSNSQCTLSGTGSSVTRSGNNLTLNVALTFNINFTGQKNVYIDAISNDSATSGFVLKGTWTP